LILRLARRTDISAVSAVEDGPMQVDTRSIVPTAQPVRPAPLGHRALKWTGIAVTAAAATAAVFLASCLAVAMGLLA
jgi:hypothetical protein